MSTFFKRFIDDDRGQDLIEYALLSGLIGITGILAWTNVSSAIFTTYGGWANNETTGVQGLWNPPDPIGGGS